MYKYIVALCNDEYSPMRISKFDNRFGSKKYGTSKFDTKEDCQIECNKRNIQK